MPKISVIIPVYNVEKYLRECLDSVINQTLKDIEIICINDGSTDGSIKILEEFAQKDSRIIVINQENQGQGTARNKGIDIASGEYIAFLDPDDFIDLDTFEVVYNRFKETNVDIVQFDYQTCEENGTFKEYHTLSKEIKKFLNFKLKDNQIFCLGEFKQKEFVKTRLCATDKIYNSSLIKQNNIRFAPTKNGEDHIVSIGATLLAQKILYINKYFYHYRLRNNSSVNKTSNENIGVFDNIQLLKDFLIKNNLFSEYEEAFNNYSIKACATHYCNIPVENDEEYIAKCRNLFKEKNFKRFLKETKPQNTFLEHIFSIKNKKVNGIKHKVFCILGFTIDYCIKGITKNV